MTDPRPMETTAATGQTLLCGETAGFLDTDGLPPIYVVCHMPDNAAGTDTRETRRQPVIMCPPLFEERKNAHRTLFGFSEALALKGHPVIRLDYPNAGESMGQPQSARYHAMVDSVRAVAGRVCAATHPKALIFVGVRFGALIATETARHHLDANPAIPVSLLLVSPIIKGKDYARRIKQRRLVRESVSTGGSASIGTESDFDGYLADDAFFDDLSKRSLVEMLKSMPDSLETTVFDVGAGPTAATSLAASPTVTRCDFIRFPPFWERIGETDMTPLFTGFKNLL